MNIYRLLKYLTNNSNAQIFTGLALLTLGCGIFTFGNDTYGFESELQLLTLVFALGTVISSTSVLTDLTPAYRND